MLTEKEKQELAEMAASAAIRNEFRMLRRNLPARGPGDIDAFVRFLTAMSRLNPAPVKRRTFVPYPSAKL